jgi:O-acetyl-ADP-ribose deacetylase (regulator of RNase III)
MYEEYRRRCTAAPRAFSPGDVLFWREAGRPAVFNLATQERYWRSRATYEAVEACLRRMREVADAEGVRSVAMPRVGAGLGGLAWTKVRAIVERAFAGWAGTLYVYEEYAAEPS